MFSEVQSKLKFGILYSTQPHLQHDSVFFETEQARNEMVEKIKKTGKIQSNYHIKPDGIEVPVSNFLVINSQGCYRRIRTEGE